MLRYTICFIRRGQEVLLLNRARAPWMGRWNGVGGKLESGETQEASVLREVLEETGIQLETAKYCGDITWSVDGERTGGMYAFLAEVPLGFVYPTPIATEEGLLDWKSMDWILHPDNQGVAANLPYYLPVLLTASDLIDHHCNFEQGHLVSVVSSSRYVENRS